MRKSLAVLLLFVAAAAVASPRVAYVFVRGSHNIICSGGPASLEVVLAKRDLYGGDFLWFRFRSDDPGYLIRDAATLDRIDRLFDPVRAYDPEAQRVETQLRPLERRESQLDREIDALTDRDDDDAELTAAEKDRLRVLQRQMDDLHAEMRILEQQESEVDHKRDALEADAERRMLPILDEAIRSGAAREIR